MAGRTRLATNLLFLKFKALAQATLGIEFTVTVIPGLTQKRHCEWSLQRLVETCTQRIIRQKGAIRLCKGPSHTAEVVVRRHRGGPARWRKLFLFSAAIALAVSGALSLGGCMSIAARGIAAIFADPRSSNHAYWAVVRISFEIGATRVTANRYAEVYWLTGGGQGSRFPPCDRGKVSCWGMTDHFFVTLPNGDVVDIFINSTGLPLPDAPPRKEFQAKASYVSVRRNRPDKNGNVWCQPASDQVEREEYHLPPRRNGFAPEIPISATFERRPDDVGKPQVIDPDKVFRSFIFDHDRCESLMELGRQDNVFEPLP